MFLPLPPACQSPSLLSFERQCGEKCLVLENRTMTTSLKQPSHVKLMLANSCWQTQIGVCERHNNMLANCWRQIELVSILANSLPVCQHELANISLTCEGRFKAAYTKASIPRQVFILQVIFPQLHNNLSSVSLTRFLVQKLVCQFLSKESFRGKTYQRQL